MKSCTVCVHLHHHASCVSKFRLLLDIIVNPVAIQLFRCRMIFIFPLMFNIHIPNPFLSGMSHEVAMGLVGTGNDVASTKFHLSFQSRVGPVQWLK